MRGQERVVEQLRFFDTEDDDIEKQGPTTLTLDQPTKVRESGMLNPGKYAAFYEDLGGMVRFTVWKPATS